MIRRCFDNYDYCMPSRTDCHECFMSVHMKFNFHYFAAIVHVFVAPTFGLVCSKLSVAFNNVYRRILKLPPGVNACAKYANNNIDSFEPLLRKRTFGFTERLEKRENS